MKITGGFIKRSIATTALLLIFTQTSAIAVPADLARKQSEKQKVQAEIDGIDAQLEPVVEEYNKANSELTQTKADIADNSKKLNAAKVKLTSSRSALNRRVVGMYRNGTVNPVQVIFGSKNFDDFVNRFDTLKRIGQSDASLVNKVLATKREVEKRRAVLKVQEKTVTAKVAEISKNKSAIEGKLAQRKQVLNSLSAEIKAELDRERQAEVARQNEEARKAKERIAAQRRSSGSSASSSGGSAPVSSRGGGRGDVVSIALSYLGVPYHYGGSSPSGFDCSGFTMYVYAQAGVSLPRVASSQYSAGTHVSRMELQPGDLVFFHNLGHVGIYIGGGQYVHAPHTGDVVKVSSLDRSDYVGAVRP